MPEPEDEVGVVLTIEEIITTQAALKLAIERGEVTVARAESVHDKLDAAIDRWEP